MSLADPKQKSSVPNPMIVVNDYLWHKMVEIDPALKSRYSLKGGGPIVPIFPISDAHTGTTWWSDKAYFLYNRVFMPPVGPFYPIKRDRFIYGLKGDVGQTFEWGGVLQALLDRQDDAAKDVNAHNRAMGARQQAVYFHHMRVHQLDPTESMDYLNDPQNLTTFMVTVEYHFTESIV